MFLTLWEMQDRFASTDWNMFFRDSSDGIEKNITSVTDFINKYIDDVVPTEIPLCPPTNHQTGKASIQD
jgi:hypothetical protein